jgi:hypothetical protein
MFECPRRSICGPIEPRPTEHMFAWLAFRACRRAVPGDAATISKLQESRLLDRSLAQDLRQPH